MVDENVFLVHAFFMGIYITFVYDLLRIARRVISHNSFWVSVEDLAFWVYCGAEVFLLMHHESDGTLRWFAVLGALVGMFLYRKTIGSLFVTYTAFVLGKVRELLVKIGKILFAPFLFAGRKAANAGNKAAKGIFGRTRRLLGQLRRHIKKELTLFVKMFRM